MATADLANIATSNGSHESFHSMTSEPNLPADGNGTNEALEDPDLQLHDVDTFLSEPSTTALLAASAPSKKRKTPVSSGSTTASPIQLGTPKTSHNVSLLYLEAQPRGIEPEFEFEGDQNGFSGSVTVCGETISSDQRWATKKEAKEGLAEKALPFVKAMKPRKTVASGPQENWIGKLLEYHNAMSPGNGPIYTEYALSGNSFACTCQIPGEPTPFGSSTVPFPSKKAARVNSAREAMQHIIAQGHTESDGSLKTKKKVKIGTAVKVEGNGSDVRKQSSYAQKVNDLSNVLGLGAPFYQLSAKPEAQSMYSGAAHFTSSPIFPSPLGEVRHVHGKKSAKEECARNVLEILKDLAKKRGLNPDEIIGSGGDTAMES